MFIEWPQCARHCARQNIRNEAENNGALVSQQAAVGL